MSEPKLRVVLADDHPVVLSGLKGLVESDGGFEVVAAVIDGHQAVQAATDHRPDVVVLDLEMPGLDGLAATTAILAAQPDAHVLILTSYADFERLAACLKAGATGCLLKDSSPEDLLRALRAVSRGEATLHPAVASWLVARLAPEPVAAGRPSDDLTHRELEVLRLVADGHDNRHIAEVLIISLPTVRSHVFHMMTKLGLENRAQLVRWALRQGIVELDTPE